MHTFIIPGKPEGKGRPRFKKFGKPYTPTKTANAQERVRSAAQLAGVPLIESGPVCVWIDCQFSHPRSKWRKRTPLEGGPHVIKPDADNVAKLIADATNGVCWGDDSQIVYMAISKRYVNQGEPEQTVVSYCAWTGWPD